MNLRSFFESSAINDEAVDDAAVNDAAIYKLAATPQSTVKMNEIQITPQ